MNRRNHLFALLLVVQVFGCDTFDSPSQSRRPSAPEPTEGHAQSDPQGVSVREAWFLKQRRYPFESIDDDVRSRAFRDMRRMQSEFELTRRGTSDGELPQWVSIGPTPTEPAVAGWQRTSGRIRAVAVSPANPDIVLIGSSSGGIWRSIDGAQDFTPVSDDQADLSVASIVFAPSDPSIVFAAMGGEFLGTGVLKSTDAGSTWKRIDESGLPESGQAQRIAVDPEDPNRVLLAQWTSLQGDGDLGLSGLYQSLDGGRTWIQRIAGSPRDVVIDPSDPSIAYAAFPSSYGENRPPTLYRSHDRGLSWSPVLVPSYDPKHFVIFRIAVPSTRPGRVYVYSSGYSTGYVMFISDDYGETWREQAVSGFSGPLLLFEPDPIDPRALYFGKYQDLFRSTDEGANWTNLTKIEQPGRTDWKTHPDQFSIAFIPGGNGEFLLGNDGGLYRSLNRADSFAQLNDTLSLTQIYGLNAHRWRSGMIFIGTQDNGLQVRRDDGTWKEFYTGDWGRPWIDPLEEDRVCANYYLASLHCFKDYGGRIERIIGDVYTFEVEMDDLPRVAFLAPFVGNGLDRTVYFATWRFFVSTNLGETWTKPAGDFDLTHGGYDVVTAIAVAPLDPDVIYVGSSEGRVMRSEDGGTNWKDISNGLSDRFVKGLVVHPMDPNRVWVTFSGYRASHVFGSIDGGSTWTDLQADLPDVPVNALWVDPGLDGEHLIVGTDIGVFRSVDGGVSWMPFSRGLPPVIVNDFDLGPDGTLFAATYGRGVYAITFEKAPRRRPVRR